MHSLDAAIASIDFQLSKGSTTGDETAVAKKNVRPHCALPASSVLRVSLSRPPKTCHPLTPAPCFCFAWCRKPANKHTRRRLNQASTETGPYYTKERLTPSSCSLLSLVSSMIGPSNASEPYVGGGSGTAERRPGSLMSPGCGLPSSGGRDRHS